jgi:hypothetical protein
MDSESDGLLAMRRSSFHSRAPQPFDHAAAAENGQGGMLQRAKSDWRSQRIALVGCSAAAALCVLVGCDHCELAPIALQQPPTLRIALPDQWARRDDERRQVIEARRNRQIRVPRPRRFSCR